MDGGAHPSTVAVPVYVGQVNRILPDNYYSKMLLDLIYTHAYPNVCKMQAISSGELYE